MHNQRFINRRTIEYVVVWFVAVGFDLFIIVLTPDVLYFIT